MRLLLKQRGIRLGFATGPSLCLTCRSVLTVTDRYQVRTNLQRRGFPRFLPVHCPRLRCCRSVQLLFPVHGSRLFRWA